ncbi:hypothetical protein PIB30_022218 [Stylosanthes scabra]|uniref:DUF1985 domain-containing protein n=1 Tax=Stylosanthes scabra TaxID=79078 RepID=A0ABU6Z7M5_9FABA|nr:hypothetical protein [Stylosanthes scabra]
MGEKIECDVSLEDSTDVPPQEGKSSLRSEKPLKLEEQFSTLNGCTRKRIGGPGQGQTGSGPTFSQVHCFSRCSPLKIVELKNLILADKSRLKEEALNDVGLVFDVPTQGDIVPKTEDLTDDAKKVVEHFKGLSFGVLKDMLAKDGVDDAWRRALILYILGAFLCPTSKNQPSPKLLGSIFDVKNPQKYNWGEFNFKWLMEMIHVYKQKNVGGSIGGCIFMLMILYFDARKFGRAYRRHEQPLIRYWTNDRIIEQGKLEKEEAQGLLYPLHEVEEIIYVQTRYKSEIVQKLADLEIERFKKQMQHLLELDIKYEGRKKKRARRKVQKKMSKDSGEVKHSYETQKMVDESFQGDKTGHSCESPKLDGNGCQGDGIRHYNESHEIVDEGNQGDDNI